MKVYCGGIEFSEIVNFKDLASSVESDCRRLEELAEMLSFIEHDDFIGMEGILMDTVKTVGWSAPRKAAKMGGQAYGHINKSYKSMKNKWTTYYKPLLVKIIKEMGAVLQGIYAKFTKLGKRYTALGEKVNQMLKYGIEQVGTLPAGTILTLHDFEAYVMKGYIEIIADYGNFYESLLSQLASDYIKPEEVVKALKSKNIRKVEDASKSISSAISSVNKYGEITIPWLVFKDNRYASFFKSLYNWKPSKDDMKGSLSDFVKRTILGKKMDYKLDVNDGGKFKTIANGYLKIMASILNNKVLEESLNSGGRSIKEATKTLVSDLDQVSNAMVVDTPVENTEEEGNTKDPNAKVNDNADPTNSILDSYVQNTNNMITKSSTAYTGIVRGVLGAMFDLVAETELIINIIENSAGKGDGK